MCLLPSYSPITGLLLDAIEHSRCSERDLTARAYDAAIGETVQMLPDVTVQQVRSVQAERSAVDIKPSGLRARLMQLLR
jgi:hypothetical protein